jgi:ubiquinone/menaquinone biosynthesis C-methylase UbiE
LRFFKHSTIQEERDDGVKNIFYTVRLIALLIVIFIAPDSILAYEIQVDTEHSLIHIGSLDSFDITAGGVDAAKHVLKAIELKDSVHAHEALKIYERLIPNENFGGEYTALAWFCEYIVSPTAIKKIFFKDKMVEAYFHAFADNDFSVLKEYIKCKYKFEKDKLEKVVSDEPEVGHTRRAFLEDFILFNNPMREEWEKTGRIMWLISKMFQKGSKIADIGCGPGYYTYKFSSLVGEEGRVYALDTKQEHIDFLNSFIKKEGINNIVTIKSKTNDICVQDKVDIAYMCSLYHIIYGVSSEEERTEFIESIKKSLKKGGKLIVVDNGPVKDTDLPYHGCYIAKELIISQLQYYGFQFEAYYQIIPQRYVLIFKI